jgi:hypothetical protein
VLLPLPPFCDISAMVFISVTSPHSGMMAYSGLITISG